MTTPFKRASILPFIAFTLSDWMRCSLSRAKAGAESFVTVEISP